MLVKQLKGQTREKTLKKYQIQVHQKRQTEFVQKFYKFSIQII